MRILLFGASGFLGRHIRARLAAEATVRAPERREFDLVAADEAAVTALLRRERPDAVVNAAGRIVGSDQDFLLAHAVVTAKLVAAMEAATPHARLVRVGSAAEYGPVEPGRPVREDDRAEPIGGYGLSHLTATRLCALAAADGRLDTVVLRVFNPLGPGMPAGNLLGRAAATIRAALERGDAQVALGLHDTYRDFVDVRDVSAAVAAALRAERLDARVCNVGSGCAVPTAQVVRLLADLAGFTGDLVPGRFVPGAARSAAVSWMCADLTRSSRALGWSPRYDLADSLASVWADCLGPAALSAAAPSPRVAGP
ncbi:NAD(P)-dependent oxidoreductase [Micromonospora sp. RP3T]|uniref:NAD-dependent epimerase/dehydratase family protein n=1 Tax=Micromonospora sp. RP3T TaxID=2135446 RepID=UPI000D17E535|nr:NAD(P)-dependent oxidoreductase [Micromonospora sp. RP3T]PTA46289.1 NAD(P)-dependent oxidoreductase [Micromonospora sp. RP3T]